MLIVVPVGSKGSTGRRVVKLSVVGILRASNIGRVGLLFHRRVETGGNVGSGGSLLRHG